MKLFKETKELNKKIKDTNSVIEENQNFVMGRVVTGEERLDVVEDQIKTLTEEFQSQRSQLAKQSNRIDNREKAAYLLEVNIKNEFDIKHETIKIDMEKLNTSLAHIPGEVDNMVATFE
jgi:flagellar biosynthesis chaperone FliJ